MSEMFNPQAPATAYDHNTTIVAVLELSGKNWLLGAVAPGLSRRTKRSLEARNVEAVVRVLEQAKRESAKAEPEGQVRPKMKGTSLGSDRNHVWLRAKEMLKKNGLTNRTPYEPGGPPLTLAVEPQQVVLG
jgi:hypothetical protein